MPLCYTSGMPKKTWNKLVRDRIPDILKQKGIRVGTHVLEAGEYLPTLFAKLVEETAELKAAAPLDSASGLTRGKPEKLQEELADVLEVLKSIADECNIPWPELEATQQAKREKRGGF